MFVKPHNCSRLGKMATKMYSPFKFSLRLRHKLRTENEGIQSKAAADVVNYLEATPEYADIKNHLPKSLLRKYKSPESMYLINRNTATEIANTIKTHLKPNYPVVEVNPGFGFLSEELLKLQNHRHYMYEVQNHQHFIQYMKVLETKYPGQLIYKIADFFGMWKLAFQDKMDEGNRVAELLGELATDDNDRIIQIVGAMPSLSFVINLINTIVFHSMTNKLGKPDLYMIVHQRHYEFLTDKEIQGTKQKLLCTLFQLLFDCKILSSVPKAHFLPWMHSQLTKKSNVMDEHFFYLIQITQKEQLPCEPEYLPLLWYFIKPRVSPKSSRIIPMLEQWIPGCGLWLITGQDPPDTKKDIAPGPGDASLPHITIFTEFGDLNLQQKITVFKKFISWPEFEQCPFRLTMENNLPKLVTRADEDDEKHRSVKSMSHVDDIEHSDTDHET